MASTHLRQALDFYNEIPTYAKVKENREKAVRRLVEIERRLDAIHGGNEVDIEGIDDLIDFGKREIQKEIRRRIPAP